MSPSCTPSHLCSHHIATIIIATSSQDPHYWGFPWSGLGRFLLSQQQWLRVRVVGRAQDISCPQQALLFGGLTVDRGCCCPGGLRSSGHPLLLLSCPVFMETDTSGGFGSPGEVWATSSSFPGPAGVAELDVLGEEEGMCVCGCGVGGCLGMRKEFLCVILCCLL